MRIGAGNPGQDRNAFLIRALRQGKNGLLTNINAFVIIIYKGGEPFADLFTRRLAQPKEAVKPKTKAKKKPSKKQGKEES